MPIFERLAVFRDEIPRSAAMNMAVDEALLDFAATPTIRFYRWDHPALSFGYFGKFAEVAGDRHQRDLVRRWTGGGIVFHGEDLTYSIVIPATDPLFHESSMSIYEKIHCALCGALAANGEHAELASVAGAHAPSHAQACPARTFDASPKSSALRGERSARAPIAAREGACAPQMCFSNPVRADVLLNGQKIAGAAQRRTHRGLLQQGSIQNVDFGNGLVERFARALSRRIKTQTIDRALIERGKKIAQEKYGSEAWLRKR